MRRLILLTLAGLVMLGGTSLAQDPLNAYIPDIHNGIFPTDTFVKCQEVVVTGKAIYGVWVQEPTAVSFERSGIWCYTSSTPPVEVGDLIDVSGRYREYYDLSEIDVSLGGQIVNRGQSPLPDPAVKSVTELTTGSPTAEDWEGVLVRIENVEVRNTGLGFGEYSVGPIGGSPFDSLRCDDTSLTAPPMPPVGAQFNSITGVIHYTFNDYKLEPRDNDDFDWIAGEPAPSIEVAYCLSNTEVVVVFDRNVGQSSAEDELNYFFANLGDFAATATLTGVDEVLLTVSTPFVPGNPVPEELQISNVENQSGTAMGTETTTFIAGINTITFVQTIGSGLDSSQVAGEMVTVTGIVTGDNTFDFVPPDGNRYYIQEPGGGQWSGIFVFDRQHAVERGQELLVAARCLEYFFFTELDDPNYVEVLSSGNPIPAPAVLPTSTLTSAALSEPWEGVLVRVENVFVNQDTSFGFGEWTVVDTPGDPDTVVVGNEGLYFYDPQFGDALGFVQGPLAYTFGDVKIEPRRWDDIDSPNGIGVEPEAAPVAVTELGESYPNPFNPSTVIRFSLREAGPVSVKIFDESGRLVRTLTDAATFDAGLHEVAWDGRDDSGRGLSSGVYLYRFEANGVVETRKLTLVK